MHQLSTDQMKINPAEGIRLCGGHEGLYYHLLSHFPTDPSMEKLEEAFMKFDARAAFLHAHTLKGLCAQLAMPMLYESACTLCDLLRTDDPQSLHKAQQMLPLLTADYKAILHEIRLLTKQHLP